MKKRILSLLLGLLLLGGTLSAQTSMRVPHGSFEQWTSHAGYSVSLMGLSLPVYDTFSTPTGWDHLAYPVNETISLFGLNVNLNTTLPLVKVSREAGSVPDSAKAVKLHTFMLSDLVNPNIYSLAENFLDSMLTQTVFPSVLSTGAVDLDVFIPIATNLLSNMDSVEDLLASLALMDVNELVSGGIALSGFQPSRLTGSYKYHSATSGDNGAVLLLGTHYNTLTHQRDVVGGGANIALTDMANYTPFTVDYVSLHQLQPSFPEQAPDSLIVLILSSAGEHMQQGSYLCVDNLVLWHDSVPPATPDTCASLASLASLPAIHEAVLNWSATAPVAGYELEYGPAGFAHGSGTLLTLTNNTVTLTTLTPNTAYTAYVRTRCSDSIYGNWASLSFTTLPDTCSRILNPVALPAIHEAHLTWSTTGAVAGYELEYGPAGFVHGSGIAIQPVADSATLYGLDPNTLYDVRLRTRCSDSVHGDWASLSFRTLPDTCASILWIEIEEVAIDGFPWSELSWQGSSNPDHWEIEYGPQGFAHGSGTLFTSNITSLNLSSLLAEELQPNTWYDFYVRSVCNDSVYGEWSPVQQLLTHCALVDSLTVRSDSLTFTPDGLVAGYRVTWIDNSNSQQWSVEYGIPGQVSPLGGSVHYVDAPYFDMPPLRPSTQYYVKVFALCGEDNYGDAVWIPFTTADLPVAINTVGAAALTVSPNPADGQCMVTLADGQCAELTLFSLDGRKLHTCRTDGAPVLLQLPSRGVFLLQAVAPSGTSTCKIVSK